MYLLLFGWGGLFWLGWLLLNGGCGAGHTGQKRGPKSRKNGPRVWAFCKIEFPGIQKPVQILAQKSGFFRNPGNRGVGVIWWVCGLMLLFSFFVWGCGVLWGYLCFVFGLLFG